MDPVGAVLIEKGMVKKEEWDVAERVSRLNGNRNKAWEVAARFGFVRYADLVRVLAEVAPLELVRSGHGGNGEEKGKVFPEEVLARTRTVVLGEVGDTIYIASLEGRKVLEELGKYTRKKIELVPCPYEKFVRDKVEDRVDWESSVKVGDVVGFTTFLIQAAMEREASDIHIDPVEDVAVVRFRVDGTLRVKFVLPEDFYAKLLAYLKNRAGMDVSEFRRPQDGSFSGTYRGRPIDFRCATLPSVHGEKFTIRILDRERAFLKLEELGISRIEEWKELLGLSSGLLLVCGPTGSGKTTTIYSSLLYLDRVGKSIYTIEDPVEYRLPFVNQVQVNRKVGLDFAAFLRTVLRHDPDVVLVGEIRDSETAKNALDLADTGHLVLATLHTMDVPSTVFRLKGLGVDTNALACLLRGILVQRLVRKICSVCQGKGCKECDDTGYRGRTPVSEFARLNRPEDLTGMIEGTVKYHRFEDDARIKISEGITDAGEIERVLGIRIGGQR